ncbi:hypothetical protein E4U41_001745 [Claviceps citrina]|nr:hypothetical protein E4U41_001745 [Claviceps citrina]
MTRLMSFAQAERVVLEGTIESQDSQAILDALRAEFAIGTRPSLVHFDAASTRATQQATGSNIGDREALTDAVVVHAARGDDVQGADSRAETTTLDRVHDAEHHESSVTSQIGHEKRSATLSAGTRPSPLVPDRKMDGSQQTPTQLNEDRDYEPFCGPLPSSPTDCTQLASTEDPRTLDPNDTGAVNFGSLSEFPRPSSQVSEDGGFQNTRGQWRLPSDVATPYKPHDVLGSLETPAMSKNPFQTKSTGSAVPFGGTQLFGQTQLLSSAVKLATPTSSRPSPAGFVNLVETSPLKNRTNVSSPTDMQTSSPTSLPGVPATILKNHGLSIITEKTPMPCQSQKDDLIPESPTSSRPAVGHHPMAYYEPMKHSQERKGSDERLHKSRHDCDSDDETFQMMERKRRAERIRAAAAKEMDRVSFVRTQHNPSPPSERPRKRRKVGVITDHDGDKESRAADGKAQAAFVRDSQKVVSQSSEPLSMESTKATPGQATDAGHEAEAEAEAPEVDGPALDAQTSEPKTVVNNDEIIPATSPLRASPAVSRRDAPSASEPELPTLRRGETEKGPDSADSADSSSLPPVRRPPRRTYGRRGREQRQRLVVELPPTQSPNEADATSEAEEAEVAVEPPNAPTSSNLEPPRQTSTRSTPQRSLVAPTASATSSSLTDLSGTPAPSSKTTPGTQNSIASGRPESVNLMSPEKSAQPSREGTTRTAATSESPQAPVRAMRLSRRSWRTDFDSTDEMHRSPSKSSRSFRPTLGGAAHRSRRLFEGMVFALSFSDNQKERTKIEAKMTQAGGCIVQEGFQELFEPSPVLLHAPSSAALEEGHEGGLTLARAHLESGFAAVIADSHSRKAKYMQALALGLPCLAPQWAYTCLKKGELVDWTPYLLCAGQSHVLGNAIRSRTLSPYPALDAKLADTLERRDKLLDGQRLLMVMDQKKPRREAKQQYLFLALALGPSAISRASTVQQAGALVRQAERSGSPFGWAYVDSSTGTTIEAVLAAATATAQKETGGKRGRRPRRGAAVAAEPSARKTLNVLTDELMIQSLILGRMVEGDEMG